MSGFYVDAEELRFIQRQLGATHKQLTLAYNKALRKTLKKLHRDSVAIMIEKTGAKKSEDIEKRVKQYSKGSTDKMASRSGKIWFGLDDMPVSALMGRIEDAPSQKRQRDSRGRFVPGRGPTGAEFTPHSPYLNPVSYPGAFMAIFNGKLSLYTRATNVAGEAYLREVRVPVMNPMIKSIELRVFSKANTLLMQFFTKELEGLVARGYGK